MAGRVGSWSTMTNGSEPSGTVTVGSGSNRMLVSFYMVEHSGDHSISTFTIGGQAADYVYKLWHDDSPADLIINVHIWNETSIAAMSGSTASFTDDITASKVYWSYATYEDCAQTDPIPLFDSHTATTSLSISTTSSTSDMIVAAVMAESANRAPLGYDTLTEQQEYSVQFVACGVADGAGGDATTTLSNDGFNSAMNGCALVLADATSAVSISSVGPADLGIIYDNELRVQITGNGFSGSGNAVKLHNTDPDAGTPSTTVTQTITAEAATSIQFTVDKGALTQDSVYLEVENSGNTGNAVVAITCYDDPGTGSVASRATPDAQDMALGEGFTLEMAPYFFATDVQDSLTFSMAGAPSGLSISNAGIISGTISDNEHASSPFTVDVTCTDLDDNAVTDQFSWTVSSETSGGASPSKRTARFRRLLGCPLLGRR